MFSFLGHNSSSESPFVQTIPQYKIDVLNTTTGREGVSDWASHTYTGYTTNAGEHFSLPAYGSVLVIPRILFGSWSRKFAYSSKELIFVILGRSFWIDYIWNEARGPVRVVLFHDFGGVRQVVPLLGSTLSRLLIDTLFQRDREWSSLFSDFTDISPAFSTEHEIGVLTSLRGKRNDVFRFLKDVVA